LLDQALLLVSSSVWLVQQAGPGRAAGGRARDRAVGAAFIAPLQARRSGPLFKLRWKQAKLVTLIESELNRSPDRHFNALRNVMRRANLNLQASLKRIIFLKI